MAKISCLWRICPSPCRPVAFTLMAIWAIFAGTLPSMEARAETADFTAAGAARGPQPCGWAAALESSLAKGLEPGAVITIDERDNNPLVGDLSLSNLRGEPGKPVVICGSRDHRAVIRGRGRFTGAAYLVLQRLDFEPEVAGNPAGPWLDVEGQHVEIRDCSVTGAPGDGLLAGRHRQLASRRRGCRLRGLWRCASRFCAGGWAARHFLPRRRLSRRRRRPAEQLPRLAQSRPGRGGGSGVRAAVLSQPRL